MLRTLYQVRQNLPRSIQRSSTRELPNFKSLVTDMTKMNTRTSSETNCTKWFECYTTTQFEFDFLEFNAATIHIIALYLSEEQQDLADGDVVTVVMKTPEQFGKKKSLIAKFVPGHQLSNAQKSSVFLELSSLSGANSKKDIMCHSITLYNVFDPEEDFFQKQWRKKRRRKYKTQSKKSPPNSHQKTNNFPNKNFIYTKHLQG
ncbi:hypothetical protein TVAGG3_0228670 [Trichomonas vaginalis G3]|uniref:hypothetical protein n=1 Tax=Trichomonas vaginalis (strain ATCC PRA-98 / G3) TaxID=412133 RepID=UPI0021E625F2|nr:hypothetical protein TVAGG3_0228670 [Trichomonas vaginalis G3]KAI5552455.1 hypothetical protein TVAGG3_0228670 [Trichomonas vaginalis G3]